jgi:4-carboxymuconolactone decarboxylase
LSRSFDVAQHESMTAATPAPHTLPVLDDATHALVRVSAVVAAGTDADVRAELARAKACASTVWIEEALLQSHLFAGFPRALNAMREWRRLVPVPPEPVASDEAERRRDGEATCAAVYGTMYERLRENVRALHPALDEWMAVDGYGKVLSRPGLDLPRRELCIVASCAASGQDRQLHSHLHGALNVGAAPDDVDATLTAIADLIGDDRARSSRALWNRVRGK